MRLTKEQRMSAGEQKETDNSIDNNETESNSLPGESIGFGNNLGENTNEKINTTNKDKNQFNQKKRKRKKGKKGKPRRKKNETTIHISF